ncbi:hypothetical protein GCK72_010127 [Caenorhabditis remanei]|uniref:Uncharacterized protein n=1 Tax=Caenorhabditis remanei TaxID=31234 RepID=A0A6A5H2F1_CAERE|nr:hypothetical protein GCK72_010127 [Caenorhabditis remanei]KAF1761868.1 hypothetical protein GCK72_010127 [Caenorhabditis remanei]
MSSDVDYPQGCLPIENSTNVSQQIERLRKLAACLYDCKENKDEEVKSPTRFARLFQHLSQSCFLDNSNPDFRLHLSLCLAHILRVFLPEVPTPTAIELKNVYIHIFRTLRGLGEITTDSPKFKHFFNLVEAIKVILHPISEMQDFDEKESIPVVRTLFREILGLTCGKGWNKNVKDNKKEGSSDEEPIEENKEDEDEEDKNIVEKVREALVTIGRKALGELDYVPAEVLDVIFYHIASPQRTNFPEARNLAESIIYSCMQIDAEPTTEEKTNPLTASIRNAMTTAAKEGKLPEEYEMTGSDSRSKFFDILRVLHFISTKLVSGATEELNFWLQSDNAQYRLEAVKIVGYCTRDRHCQFGMDSSDATWTAFLNAAKDQESSVRKEFVTQSKSVLVSNHSHLRGQIINCLLRLSKDPQDEVRLNVVQAVTEVSKSKLEAISDKLLKLCAERMKDKKPNVRNESIKLMMDLYHHVMTSKPQKFYSKDSLINHQDTDDTTLPYTESDKECVRFIPNAVFNVYRLTQRTPAYLDSRLIIERYVQKNFIPYEIDPKERMKIMADMYRNLDDIGCLMFGDIVNRSSQLRRAIMGILSGLGKYHSDSPSEFSAQMKDRIRRIIQIFPDASNLEKAMMTFINTLSENSNVFDLVKKMMGDCYISKENADDTLTVRRSVDAKLKSKLQQTSFRQFLDRVIPLSFDSPAAKELIHLVSETVCAKIDLKNWAQGCFERDLGLLKLFSEYFAHVFADKDIVEEIRSKILTTDEPRAVEVALHALSKIFQNSNFKTRMEDESIRREKWFLSISKNLKELVTRSDPELRRSCKLATRLLAGLLGKDKAVEFFDGEFDTLLYRLDLETPGCANSFQVLAEIFRTDIPHYFSRIMEILESDKIGPLIMTSPQHDEEDPIEFNDLIHFEKQPSPKYTSAKVYAAKFAAKVLSSCSLVIDPVDKQDMERVGQKFIDLSSEIIDKNGDLGGRQCDLEKARLRSTAAACLLKLATIITWRTKMHTGLYKNMSYMITDEAYCVRLYYALHIKKGLGRRLPIEFAACYGLINLGLVEEEGENKLEGFKTICMNQAHQSFVERNDEKANILNLQGAQRTMFCAETVVAYVVWLLANYGKLEKLEGNADKNDSEDTLALKASNVNLLSELQESLWLVIDMLKIAKCNMQKVWKYFEKLKTCGDKSMRSDGRVSTAQLREHNKKIWAICDLGISMMLYRAKLQMEDQESNDTGFNLQFFYVCNVKDKADPSNVYAPDVLINSEKQRNGRLPKPGHAYQVTDITAEFSPPPQSNETNVSNSSKNASKRGAANTSTTKSRKVGGKKNRRSGASKASDDAEDDSVIKSPPASKKTRSKRGVYDPPEEEDDEMEIIPLPKRRGAPPVTFVPSSSSSNGNTSKNGTSSPNKSNSRKAKGRQNSKQETEIESSSDEEETEKANGVSLDNLVISPILNESSGRARRSARTIAATATITASTPLVPPKAKNMKRKRSDFVPEEGDMDYEDPPIASSPSPKKRTSARIAPSTPTTKKEASATAAKKPASSKFSKKSPAKTNGTSPKKNKYGLPMEEEEEEQTASTSRQSVRTRARLSKK